MKRILVLGAGGSPATNFIRSLRSVREKFYIVGTDADKYYLMRSEADKNYLVPWIKDKTYFAVMQTIIKKEKIAFIHIQTDNELRFFGEHRAEIPARLFLPNQHVIEICQDKYLSFEKWKQAGIKVPDTMIVTTKEDLQKAFEKFGGKIWLRATSGAGGRGSFPTNDFKTAVAWLDFQKGWDGTFTAAELLTPHSVTWMSLWHNGELVVAQGRKRLYWELAKISPSGITGATGAGLTVSDKVLDKIAQQTIFAIDQKPHGLYGVDLTYDDNGIPNPTEINIGRFFTTHHFFTQAGVNMPYIYLKLAFNERVPKITRRINPLPNGLVWIRGMDFKPVLTTEKKIEANVLALEKLKAKLAS